MANLTLVIGTKNYSSWSLRPWLALKHTGAPFREVVVDLDRPDTAETIAKYSPSGRVPVLVEGDIVVHDSLAICEYLHERFPQAKLWPEPVRARAVARSVTAEMHSGFTALRTHCGMDLRNRYPGQGLDQPGVAEDVARIEALWTECRQKYGALGPFLFGHFTIADAFYAPVVTRFVTYGAQVGPVARAYMDAVLADPAMREWVQAAEADTYVPARYGKK